jgi:mRNA-degrading endonuclease RelE of RelBE toxin-antitoxin system
MFKIKYEDKAKKFIKKLDFSIKQRVIEKIKSLELDPFPRQKKHILETAGSSILCELPIDKLRIYYTVEDRFIVIEEIEYGKIIEKEYKGLVKILEGKSNHKSGNKENYPNQRKDINRLKKWFSNIFKK